MRMTSTKFAKLQNLCRRIAEKTGSPHDGEWSTRGEGGTSCIRHEYYILVPNIDALYHLFVVELTTGAKSL